MKKLMITLAALMCLCASRAGNVRTENISAPRANAPFAPRFHHDAHADLTTLMQKVYRLSADQTTRLQSVNREMQEARKDLFDCFHKKADGATSQKAARLSKRLDRKMETLMNHYTAQLRDILTDSQYKDYVMDYQKHEARRYSRMAQMSDAVAERA